MKSGLCIPNMVYLVQFVCLSDGVNLKVVATSIAEIERPVYHDVRNSMPHPILLHDQFPDRDISGLRIFRGYSCNKYCFVALLLLHVVCEIGLNFHHSFAFIASIFVCVRNRSFTEHISRNYTGQAY